MVPYWTEESGEDQGVERALAGPHARLGSISGDFPTSHKGAWLTRWWRKSSGCVGCNRPRGESGSAGRRQQKPSSARVATGRPKKKAPAVEPGPKVESGDQNHVCRLRRAGGAHNGLARAACESGLSRGTVAVCNKKAPSGAFSTLSVMNSLASLQPAREMTYTFMFESPTACEISPSRPRLHASPPVARLYAATGANAAGSFVVRCGALWTIV